MMNMNFVITTKRVNQNVSFCGPFRQHRSKSRIQQEKYYKLLVLYNILSSKTKFDKNDLHLIKARTSKTSYEDIFIERYPYCSCFQSTQKYRYTRSCSSGSRKFLHSYTDLIRIRRHLNRNKEGNCFEANLTPTCFFDWC